MSNIHGYGNIVIIQQPIAPPPLPRPPPLFHHIPNGYAYYHDSSAYIIHALSYPHRIPIMDSPNTHYYYYYHQSSTSTMQVMHHHHHHVPQHAMVSPNTHYSYGYQNHHQGHQPSRFASRQLHPTSSDNNTYDQENVFDEDVMIMDEIGGQEDEIGGQEDRISERYIMNNLNIKNFKKSEESDESCAICLNEFEEDEKIGILECQHQFHTQCLSKWLMQNNSCPMCRGRGL